MRLKSTIGSVGPENLNIKATLNFPQPTTLSNLLLWHRCISFATFPQTTKCDRVL